MLDVVNVSISVQNSSGFKPLLHAVDLHLSAGQILPLQGASGIGKSTLLRSFVRLHPLSDGQVVFLNRPLEQWLPSHLRILMTYVPQTHTTVEGDVFAFLSLPFTFHAVRFPPPERAELADRLAAWGLKEDILDQPVQLLSGGEIQRVGLLRALLLKPQILLLDEPTAHLDTAHQILVIERIRDWVAAEQRAVLWVAHSTEVIRRLGVEPLDLTLMMAK